MAVEPFFTDLKRGASKGPQRKLLDGKAYGFSGSGETPVAHRRPSRAPRQAWEQFCLSAVVKVAHAYPPLEVLAAAAL
jgi:hypothetical protein